VHINSVDLSIVVDGLGMSDYVITKDRERKENNEEQGSRYMRNPKRDDS
jgi:hypothetical protein